MPLPRTDRIAAARRKLEQVRADLQRLEAREAQEARKRDTRRKIILGGLLLDAAAKEPRYAGLMHELIARISRPQDKVAFGDVGPARSATLRGPKQGRAYGADPRRALRTAGGRNAGPRTPARIFSKGWVFRGRLTARYSQGWR